MIDTHPKRKRGSFHDRTNEGESDIILKTTKDVKMIEWSAFLMGIGFALFLESGRNPRGIMRPVSIIMLIIGYGLLCAYAIKGYFA